MTMPPALAAIARTAVIFAGLVAVWQAIVSATGVPHYILPPPYDVATVLVERFGLLMGHAWVTLVEIILGLALGTLLGTGSALLMASFRQARLWLLPLFVVSQAIPVIALAPILILWIGFGLWSKVAMATMIIYFPVTAAFYDGLRRTEPGWLDLAQTMDAGRGAILRHIRAPAALPAFASGMRVAAAAAPIGAVVGEWVGSTAGLGRYIWDMNSRPQADAMFAALLILALMAVALYFSVDYALRRALPWLPESDPSVSGQSEEQ